MAELPEDLSAADGLLMARRRTAGLGIACLCCSRLQRSSSSGHQLSCSCSCSGRQLPGLPEEPAKVCSSAGCAVCLPAVQGTGCLQRRHQAVIQVAHKSSQYERLALVHSWSAIVCDIAWAISALHVAHQCQSSLGTQG